jgi:hypothetical protein
MFSNFIFKSGQISLKKTNFEVLLRQIMYGTLEDFTAAT